MSQLIEVPVEAGEEKHVFKFRKMRIEEAGAWSSRMKARMVVHESVQRQIEEMEKLPDDQRDDEKYITLSDRQANMFKEILALSRELTDYIVEPGKEVVDKWMESNSATMLAAFMDYLSKVFPDEADKKKS